MAGLAYSKKLYLPLHYHGDNLDTFLQPSQTGIYASHLKTIQNNRKKYSTGIEELDFVEDIFGHKNIQQVVQEAFDGSEKALSDQDEDAVKALKKMAGTLSNNDFAAVQQFVTQFQDVFLRLLGNGDSNRGKEIYQKYQKALLGDVAKNGPRKNPFAQQVMLETLKNNNNSFVCGGADGDISYLKNWQKKVLGELVGLEHLASQTGNRKMVVSAGSVSVQRSYGNTTVNGRNNVLRRVAESLTGTLLGFNNYIKGLSLENAVANLFNQINQEKQKGYNSFFERTCGGTANDVAGLYNGRLLDIEQKIAGEPILDIMMEDIKGLLDRSSDFSAAKMSAKTSKSDVNYYVDNGKVIGTIGISIKNTDSFKSQLVNGVEHIQATVPLQSGTPLYTLLVRELDISGEDMVEVLRLATGKSSSEYGDDYLNNRWNSFMEQVEDRFLLTAMTGMGFENVQYMIINNRIVTIEHLLESIINKISRGNNSGVSFSPLDMYSRKTFSDLNDFVEQDERHTRWDAAQIRSTELRKNAVKKMYDIKTSMELTLSMFVP